MFYYINLISQIYYTIEKITTMNFGFQIDSKSTKEVDGIEEFLGEDPSKIFENADDSKNGNNKNKNKNSKELKTDDAKDILKRFEKTGQRKTKDEINKSQTVIMTLLRYGASQRFNEYLSKNGFKLTPTVLNKLAIDELEELLERVKICIANKSESSLITNMVLTGIRTAEHITQRPGLKELFDLLGWSTFIENDESFMDSLEEIRISSSLVTGLSAPTRIVIALGSSALQVSRTNAAARSMLNQLAINIPNADELKSDSNTTDATHDSDVKHNELKSPDNNYDNKSNDFLGLGESKRDAEMPEPVESKLEIDQNNKLQFPTNLKKRGRPIKAINESPISNKRNKSSD